MRLSRMSWVILLTIAIWFVMLGRTFQIQVIDSDKYTKIANMHARDQIGRAHV